MLYFRKRFNDISGNEMEQIEGTSAALKYKWHFTNQPIFI